MYYLMHSEAPCISYINVIQLISNHIYFTLIYIYQLFLHVIASSRAGINNTSNTANSFFSPYFTLLPPHLPPFSIKKGVLHLYSDQ